jgi:hypothetical protein
MKDIAFNTGSPGDLILPSLEVGYGIRRDFVKKDFSARLFEELKNNRMYSVGGSVDRGEPGVYHNSDILSELEGMPLLDHYISGLNDSISEITGDSEEHLTYLTVRSCPVGEMSTWIHRNDRRAGPWLVSLVLDGSGSFSVYDNDVIEEDEEIELIGDDSDPIPITTSAMSQGDACAIYSENIAHPHAGGRNTSIGPKVLLLLYGWDPYINLS